MPNEQNLRPFTSDQSHDEAVKNGKKGGIASGEARRKARLLKDLLADEFEKPIKVNDVEITKKELAALRLVRVINDPDTSNKDFLRALEFARDTIGEKPIEKVMIAEVDPETVDMVEKMVLDYDKRTSD